MNVKHFRNKTAAWHEFAFGGESKLNELEVLIYRKKSGLFYLDDMESIIDFSSSFQKVLRAANKFLSHSDS